MMMYMCATTSGRTFYGLLSLGLVTDVFALPAPKALLLFVCLKMKLHRSPVIEL